MRQYPLWIGGWAAIAALGLWPAGALAVPAQLNVQGVLFDETGEPLEGATTATFRLYDAAGAGAPVWEPAAPLDVLCEAGVFNALVPAATEGAEVDALAAAFTAGEPRWLGIAPAGGAELSPRIPVVSVAYALVAGKAAVAEVAELARGLDCAGCVPATALDPAVQAAFLAYDGSASGLAAATYQAAIDELAALVRVLRTDLTIVQTRVDGLAAVATSGAYGDLTGAPDLSGFAETADLALVATSGAYGDLTGAPDLSGFAETADLAPVAFSNSYADLHDTPDVCAAALACPAVLDLQARLWCLENCDPQRLGDCRARTCDGATETCTDTGALPDGTACGGGNGRCVGGECFGAFCGGVSCPYLAGYRVACNAQAHCEYAPVDAAGWREWDVWIWVPAGSFLMGSPDGEVGGRDEDRPVHRVTLAYGFFIMKYEIVVAHHMECERDGSCTRPQIRSGWDGDGWNVNGGGRDSHPQNALTPQDARRFCAWAAPGGRLPSEAEWEYAATGPVHRKYPWGDTPEPDCDHAVFDPDGSGTRPFGCNSCTTDGCSGTQPVGSKPAGASYVGALDMAGNVVEWCEDCSTADYDLNDDGDVLDGPPYDAPLDGSAWRDLPAGVACSHIEVRGGVFSMNAQHLMSALRNGATDTHSAASIGARCVRPLPQ